MELLLSLAITILAQGFKKLVNKIGLDYAKFLVLSFVFLLSGIYAYLKYQGLPLDVIAKEIATVGLSAIGIYEIVYKRLISPIFNKIK